MTSGSPNHCCGLDYAVHHPAFWIMTGLVVVGIGFVLLFVLADGPPWASPRSRKRMVNKMLGATSAEKIRFLESGDYVRLVLPEDNPNLVEFLARDSDPSVAEVAIQKCPRILSERCGVLLVDLTRNPNPRIASALLRLTPYDGVEYSTYERVARSLVRHPDAEIRRQASEVDLDGWRETREQLDEQLRREMAAEGAKWLEESRRREEEARKTAREYQPPPPPAVF